jgi:hypothetical protein
MMLTRAAWCLVIASACSKTPETKTIVLAGMRAVVPGSWSASADTAVQRLEAAGRRRDPAADLQVNAFGPSGSRAPSLTLISIQHSREYTQNANPRTMARDAVAEAKQAASAQGIAIKSSHDCATHHCNFSMSLEGTVSSHVRARSWRVDGRLVWLSCIGDRERVRATVTAGECRTGAARRSFVEG